MLQMVHLTLDLDHIMGCIFEPDSQNRVSLMEGGLSARMLLFFMEQKTEVNLPFLLLCLQLQHITLQICTVYTVHICISSSYRSGENVTESNCMNSCKVTVWKTQV